MAPLQPLGELGAGERRAARAVCVRVCVWGGCLGCCLSPVGSALRAALPFSPSLCPLLTEVLSRSGR